MGPAVSHDLPMSISAAVEIALWRGPVVRSRIGNPTRIARPTGSEDGQYHNAESHDHSRYPARAHPPFPGHRSARQDRRAVLVHTGQNYDYALKEVFFSDLAIRKPDHVLGVDTSSLGRVLGETLIRTEEVLSPKDPTRY